MRLCVCVYLRFSFTIRLNREFIASSLPFTSPSGGGQSDDHFVFKWPPALGPRFSIAHGARHLWGGRRRLFGFYPWIIYWIAHINDAHKGRCLHVRGCVGVVFGAHHKQLKLTPASCHRSICMWFRLLIVCVYSRRTHTHTHNGWAWDSDKVFY